MKDGEWIISDHWIRDYARRHAKEPGFINVDSTDLDELSLIVEEELRDKGTVVFEHQMLCNGPAHGSATYVLRFDDHYFSHIDEVGYSGPFKTLKQALDNETSIVNPECDTEITCEELDASAIAGLLSISPEAEPDGKILINGQEWEVSFGRLRRKQA